VPDEEAGGQAAGELVLTPAPAQGEASAPDGADMPSLYRAVGCEHCGYTGYQGRVGVYELLETTAQIREQIHNRASEAEVRATAQADGMRTMREDGQRWLASGLTTRAELLRVTKD
jgi:general secretion pathway protein E